jgi:hypothetical protein
MGAPSRPGAGLARAQPTRRSQLKRTRPSPDVGPRRCPPARDPPAAQAPSRPRRRKLAPRQHEPARRPLRRHRRERAPERPKLAVINSMPTQIQPSVQHEHGPPRARSSDDTRSVPPGEAPFHRSPLGERQGCRPALLLSRERCSGSRLMSLPLRTTSARLV